MRSRVEELGGAPDKEMGPLLVWQEVVSMEEATPPPGTYEVPSGYTERE